MFIQEKTLDDVLHRVYGKLLSSEQRQAGRRGKRFHESSGILIELTNPLSRLSRSHTRGRVLSALGEALWYLAGDDKIAFIDYHVRDGYADDTLDGIVVPAAYGPRLVSRTQPGQIDNVIELLKYEPESKRAVVQLFEAADIIPHTKELSPPCTCSFQFLIRDGRLNMFVTMRSNDAYLGLPHDIFCFTFLQEFVARAVGAELGVYKHFVGSLHLYEGDEPYARQYLGEGYQSTIKFMPAMPQGDPRPSMAKLLDVEAALREREEIVVESLSDLDPYWLDLVRLLEFRAAGKRGDRDRQASIRTELSSQIYRTYLLRGDAV